MSDPKDPAKNGGSFFRKVVRFVANPTTDWADLNHAPRESPENDQARTEIKAMIERKRRNDFVRKREFDMLRKIRREGLTGENVAGIAAGIDNLSHMDDSEVRNSESARTEMGVKDKIDAIERQMVGEGLGNNEPPKRSAAVMRSPMPASMNESFLNIPTTPSVSPAAALADAFKPTAPLDMHSMHDDNQHWSTRQPAPSSMMPTTQSPSRVSVLASLQGGLGDGGNALTVEVTELAHDPDLDEAVIAFANADFESCEQSLIVLIGASGSRSQHSDTWFALFDLYRATGQQQKFEALAMDYVQRFGWSAPQWYSMPRQVADALASRERPPVHKGPGNTGAGTSQSAVPRGASSMGWISPEAVDVSHIAQLRSLLLQMPLPWVLDWRALRSIDVPACQELHRLLGEWANEPVEMRWVGGEHFLDVLAQQAPANQRQVDPSVWLLRLEVQRLANQAVEFDQTAIDYCLTYEVSPPSWMPARCSLRIASSSGVTISPSGHQIPEVATGFFESEPQDETVSQVAQLELSGNLVGDIGPLLRGLESGLGTATMVKISCSHLIRMDFIAAGDLLNWVLARRAEKRSVQFEETHRLVALFCGAMGINEHARVTVRNI